jgi:hypothetical protein
MHDLDLKNRGPTPSVPNIFRKYPSGGSGVLKRPLKNTANGPSSENTGTGGSVYFCC